MSDSVALFFVGLWNAADDDGKLKFDPVEISIRLGSRWDAGKVRLFVGKLVAGGQLVISRDSAWLRVVNWSHQKIDRPRRHSVKAEEIEWLNQSDSTKALESSRKCGAVLDGIGIGKVEDRIPLPGDGPSSPAAPKGRALEPKKKSRSLPSPETKTGRTWSAYAAAYRARYGEEPARNAQGFGICSRLVDRLGADEAPEVAAFYLGHNDSFYVRSLHPLALLLRDAEKLRTEWKVGRQMTQTTARRVEQAQSNADAIRDYLADEGA
ncbi:MAG TPA: hypothetical protein VEB22_00700 [Phycisphaerales bacterium]|nr:hypothetical protein [Phycisphaerales bacterium]